MKPNPGVSFCLNSMRNRDVSKGPGTMPNPIAHARRMLARCGHTPTPLVFLPGLARGLGVREIMVKDESAVLGLGSFKARGVYNAMASLLEAGSARNKLFVTATDGNHGLAVAEAASRLGGRAQIFMPAGASLAIRDAILASGAQCEITAVNYDDTVRMASQYAEASGATLLQDTAWPGYEKIPRMIMAGYGTMVAEILETGAMPTHVFLQVGVGSFASAFIEAYIAIAHGKLPRFISMEPEAAACVFKSISQGDGTTHQIAGQMATAMFGLACGEPSSLAWPILRASLFAAMACEDALATKGMHILAQPSGDDPKVASGASGAIGAGLIDWLMLDKNAQSMRQTLGLDETSSILLVSTEGDSFAH